ncbi:hypothetical protein IFM89_009656 [Coptis chinensis]|uniref:Sas10 C-terminal domain-containing protein n=1 Tax=Coptis chinensis TaxID=261450 RepID=A0A835IMF4_9MAGN|nr:hypothetical protein IFM89_009656 [Coptis chinensis]
MGKRGRNSSSNQKKEPNKPLKIRDDVDFNEDDDMDDEIDAFYKQRDIIPLDVDEDVASSDEDNDHPIFNMEGVDDDDDDENDYRDTGLAAKSSSDEELPAEEEVEVLRVQKEKAKSYSLEDFGQDDSDQEESDSDEEKAQEGILPKTRSKSKRLKEKGAEDDTGIAYEVKKDLNALSREEQMDVVYSSAPELVGLLSELNDALDQLENKVNPLISKVKKGNDSTKGGMRYLETKQQLLLAYCQAISFYLLLKSEGHSVRDHPVIARLVEIKNFLDKVSSSKLFLKKLQPREKVEMVNGGISEGKENKHEKRKRQVGSQSMEMLKVRASLEEKLKQKGIFSSVTNKLDINQKLHSRRLETLDDFGDEVMDKESGNANLSNGRSSSMHSTKLLKVVAPKLNKLKVVSGDDDLPKRDDIGERRRKHELRVLANAGVESKDEIGDEDDGEEEASENEFYEQVKKQKISKLSAKAELYSRTPWGPSSAEPEIVDGKRQITRQIEKNRGLTRSRKKQNPRTKYKEKHQKKVNRRKGQVRGIKKPTGPYGGEATGINAGISRSIRLK